MTHPRPALPCFLLLLALFGSRFAPPAGAQAQQNVLAELWEMNPMEVRVGGFVLDEEAAVQVEAVGLSSHRDDFGLGDAWILDAATREVVWDFESAAAQEEERYIRTATRTLRLPPGTYEVYYAVYPTGRYDRDALWMNSTDIEDFVRIVMDEIFDRDNLSEWNDFYRRHGDLFGITVRGPGRRIEADEIERAREQFRQEALLALTKLDNNRFVYQGFELERPMEVDIYALGEMWPNASFDYGWITNVDTRERVWTMTYPGTAYGGGTDKNRRTRTTVRLPTGRYAAFFVTDDSHAYDDWNAAPPVDPPFWGITLRAADPARQPYASLFEYRHGPPDHAIVSLQGLGNDVHRTATFTLEEEQKVHIDAFGEGRNGRMVDYGWIENAASGERLWTMRYRETEHGGGGRKNRYLHDVIRLPAGSYTAHFITDGAHSAEGWNETPPFDPAAWGLTILPADPDEALIRFTSRSAADAASKRRTSTANLRAGF